MSDSSPHRIAFVFGSNGPQQPDQLKFAANDVEKISIILKEYCRFDVRNTPGRNSYAVLEALNTAAAGCKANDDFLIYFSGHGVLDGGQLFLLLDDSNEQLFTSALRASLVMDALKYSNASNKILILDCCHAGAATGLRGDVGVSEIVSSGPSSLVLCASDRLERAREFETLKGSFLAHETSNIVSSKEHLSVTLLARELRIRAQIHNDSNPDLRVPLPYLIGELKNDFMLRGEALQTSALTPVSEYVYRKLAAAAAPLTSVTLKLTVKQIPASLSSALQKRVYLAKNVINEEPFKDLWEHHNVDEDDAEHYVRLEMQRKVIQPFINVLTDLNLREAQGILAIGFEKRCRALFCLGWIDKPDLFDMAGNLSLIPSGVLVEDQLIFWPDESCRPSPPNQVQKTNRPQVQIDVTGNTVTLTLDVDHTSFEDALLLYSKSPLTATLPEDVVLFTWIPSTNDTEGADHLPFDTKNVHESVLKLASSTVSTSSKRRPSWVRHMSLDIVPNNTELIAKAYDLTLVGSGYPSEGPRGDDEVGYIQTWHGRSRPLPTTESEGSIRNESSHYKHELPVLPPPKPASLKKDDIQKNRWGSKARGYGRRLFISELQEEHNFFSFDAVLESTDGTELKGPFYFHLHNTYKPSKIKITKTHYGNQRAILEEINSDGTYTLGVQFKDSAGQWRSLEYDLSAYDKGRLRKYDRQSSVK